MKNKQLNLHAINYKGFADDIEKLRAETFKKLNLSDFYHLKKIEWWGRVCTIIGYATSWIIPNPISAFLISQGILTRWFSINHSISHRGYDKVPDVPKRYTSAKFANGWRRYIDWFDWITPKEWNNEHNLLHHYNLGSHKDPDLNEYYTYKLRRSKMPIVFKYLIIFFAAITWKFVFLSPIAFNSLEKKDFSNLRTFDNVKLWIFSYTPYILFNFILLPLFFFPLGSTAILFVFLNRILAELITNFHTYVLFSSSHTANDLYLFKNTIKNKQEFYARQVLGTTNYLTGKDSINFLHAWINFHIEHHLFPDLPLSKYKEIQPKVKALCKKYNLPYRQESVWIRFKKMLDVNIGKTSMIQIKSLPI